MAIDQDGGLLWARTYQAARTQDQNGHVRVHDFDVRAFGDEVRIAVAADWDGRLPAGLGEMTTRYKNGLVFECVLSRDEADTYSMQRESSLFIAATTNHARTTSVSIDAHGGVYAIGYRYDTTVVGNQESINTIDRHRHTDTWIVYHRPNGEVSLIDRLIDNAHDIVGNGIVALSDARYVATANSVNTVHSKAYLAGLARTQTPWQRLLQPDANAFTKFSRIRRMRGDHLVVGGYSTADGVTLTRDVAVDAPELDERVERTFVGGLAWIQTITTRQTGQRCDGGECVGTCGDGFIGPNETCDDGNAVAEDGCSAACEMEAGYRCEAPGLPCRPICGDGVRTANEGCDDGNLNPSDGCSDQCQIVAGYVCDEGRPSVCRLLPNCGDQPEGELCFDENIGRCEPAADCPDYGRPPWDGSGLGCTARQAGERRPCSTNVGSCREGYSQCDGERWSDCLEAVSPSAERCNAMDDDCDGRLDEGLGMVSCGVGACSVQTQSCLDGQPVVCEPRAASTEVCNGIDDDCDGTADEALNVPQTCGVGACARTVSPCQDGTPEACQPGLPSPEQCNGVDDDCDGEVDELPNQICGAGRCMVNAPRCVDGADNACVPNLNEQQEAESCNFIDDDCDDNIDEDIEDIECGVGECRRRVRGCINGQAPICEPGQPIAEICNGLDDDCDGAIDNGLRCFPFDCELADDPNCQAAEPEGENRPPVIHPDTTIVAPVENAVLCQRFPGGNPFDGGGAIPGDEVDNDDSNGGLIVFQTCGFELQYSDPDGLKPRLIVDWGDGVIDDPVRWPCRLQGEQEIYWAPHRYTEAGQYRVTLRAEDNDGLAVQAEYNLTVTLPRTVTRFPCGGFDCTQRIPGTCTVSSPLYYVDDNDACIPLDGATFCDPNNPDTFCPDNACADGNGGPSVNVYTVTEQEPQWFWAGDGFINVGEELAERPCGSAQNARGWPVRFPCNRQGVLNATSQGIARNAFVKVGNLRPRVNIVASPDRIRAGELIEFVAEGTDDDGEVVRYRWEIGDRQIAADGPTAQFFVEAAGTYVVKVTAFDDAGARGIDAREIEVVVDDNSFGIDTGGVPSLHLANDVNTGELSLTIPNGVDMAMAEIWLGHRTNRPDRNERLRGRIEYSRADDAFRLVNDPRDESTGAHRLLVDEQSQAEQTEDGLVIRFVYKLKGGFNEPRRAAGPIDIAYRVRLSDDTYLDATVVNEAGWFNAGSPFYAIDLRPSIYAYDQRNLTTNQTVIFGMAAQRDLIFYNEITEARERILAVSSRWTFGDGRESDRPTNLYAWPGRYAVQLEITYENGWQVQSAPLNIIIRGDTDGDGVEDHLDPDNDNDGICDEDFARLGVCEAGPDALPRNPHQHEDRDGDGIGDDLDGCRELDFETDATGECRGDAFPDDPNEWRDTDGDGTGDNADDDDDGDGLTDDLESLNGLNPVLRDTDGDGLSDGEEFGLIDGAWPGLDSDGDGTFNHLDVDSDDDGLPDGHEPFPMHDHDGDGLIAILDPDADNDGVLDGVDRTPWAAYAPAQEPDFWRDRFPTGYYDTDAKWGVIDFWGELEKQFVLPGPPWDFGTWNDVGDPTESDLPSARADSLVNDVLPKINTLVADSGYACRSPELGRSALSRTRSDTDYYGPSAPVHLYHEYIRYFWRTRDVRTTCGWTEPGQIEDAIGRPFWQSTGLISLRTGVDNFITIQFTMDANPLDDLLNYGEGREVGERRDTHYVLPAFEYRIYGRGVDDGGQWANSADPERLQFHGTSVAEKLKSTSVNGHPIFEVRLRIPRESIEARSNWFVLSPRLEYRTYDTPDPQQLAIDPIEERMVITSLEHGFSGPNAHLVTRIGHEQRWDEVKDKIIDHFADANAERLDLDALMTTPSAIYNVGGPDAPTRIGIVNRSRVQDAIIDPAWIDDPSVVGILVLTYRPGEVAPLVNDHVICAQWDGCDWYKTDNGDADGARSYQAGNIFNAGARLNLTNSRALEVDEWYQPQAADVDSLENAMGDGRDWQRTLNSFIDGVDGYSMQLHQLKFDRMEFTPMGTLDGVFNKYGILVECRAGGHYQPLWEIRVTKTELALADGVDPDLKWAGRNQGIYFEKDIMAERISTGWDDAGQPIPPRQFMQHGDVRTTGTTAGSAVVDRLLDANRAQDAQRFSDLIQPARWHRVLDTLTSGVGIGLAGYGVILGGGMMMKHSISEDGFWEGAILTGQSVAELYTEVRAVQASAHAARATNLATYGTRMAAAGKWAKRSALIGSVAEVALASYYGFKYSQTENPIDRRRYAPENRRKRHQRWCDRSLSGRHHRNRCLFHRDACLQ